MSKNIYVGNLAWSVGDDDLRDLFQEYGEVISARVIEDRETGRSRGFGFVEMEDNGALEAIDALNGSVHDGRNLKVNEARPRERRPRY
ncbi:RNA recognition motif domain-containing protein [Halodesulfovibrio aestuarii]|uniref:RNA recognition motif domain-containing protein n=1 Tax=Halodesulfovibrio aestuarii TaxID=126333 RepID=A0A8G2FGG8_9BACT|nr:RNA-binding protein [Halodesulfovibrio aestuarii]SHI52605.1 RNA recognition motif. (a.k.a. RRM, RBD, or RNP domain) [Halodesulfovibrio aestuarii]